MALPGGKLGFALATTPNDRRSSFARFVCGHNVPIEVLGRVGKRILCGVRGNAATGALKATGAAADGGVTEAVSGAMPEVGAVCEATVKAVKPSQINLAIEGKVQGRVHVTEFHDPPKIVDGKPLPSVSRPFDGIKVGDRVRVRVIGTHHAKTHRGLAITHKGITKPIAECTMRPSKLDANKSGDALVAVLTPRGPADFIAGGTELGYVQSIEPTTVWVALSVSVRGRAPAKRAFPAGDAAGAKAGLEGRFKPGDPFWCTVRQNAKGSKPVDLAAAGAAKAAELPAKGSIVTGATLLCSLLFACSC